MKPGIVPKSDVSCPILNERKNKPSFPSFPSSFMLASMSEIERGKLLVRSYFEGMFEGNIYFRRSVSEWRRDGESLRVREELFSPSLLVATVPLPNIDNELFQALSKNALVYDGRLDVDSVFRTADPYM